MENIALRGFSLLELLVATAVGSLASAGALSGLMQARAAWRAADTENRLHERAQYAFATLETELQMAGYFAGSLPTSIDPSAVPGPETACGNDTVARLGRPIEVSDAHYALPCGARGQGHLPATDVVLVRRASVRTAPPDNGRLQWISCPDMLCAPRLVWSPMASSVPGQVRDLIVRVFYVARAADGDSRTPALRVKSLSAVAGVPAFIDTEVMPGVDDLQITLEPNPAAPVFMRVTLGVRADVTEQQAGRPLRRRSITRLFALRNAEADAA